MAISTLSLEDAPQELFRLGARLQHLGWHEKGQHTVKKFATGGGTLRAGSSWPRYLVRAAYVAGAEMAQELERARNPVPEANSASKP